MLAACVFEDPPPYTEPKQTPPRLALHRAAPAYDQVIVAQTGDGIAFNIPVTSEDAGDPIQGTLFLDFDGQNARSAAQAFQVLPASTLDEGERPWVYEWKVEAGLSGCHRFTVIFAHQSNLGASATTWPPSNWEVLDKGDQAWAVWWTNLNATEPATLTQCPLAGGGGR